MIIKQALLDAAAACHIALGHSQREALILVLASAMAIWPASAELQP